MNKSVVTQKKVDDFSIPVNFTVQTTIGLWSRASKPVKITHIEYTNNDYGSADVNVYFDTKTWDVDKDGLIYTDAGFLKALKQNLETLSKTDKLPKVNWNEINYTEQGMQGDNYISMEFP